MRAMTVMVLTLLANTAAAAPRRVAVVVGANAAAPGRQPLRYSHRDAAGMAAILSEVGGFRRQDIRLLEDPTPADLLDALAAASAALAGHPDSVLYFYYSGHADERALYPSGRPLAFDRLRALVDASPASVKIGMVDACRGGAWTRAKGLSPDQPFAVEWPVTLGNEGSVLIASSSGLESAHESDHLRGSFFTTHFVAALRGAADRDGNGEVTLTEAFDYAKERTIRDSARLTQETQHPSYAVSLRGRRDLVLAQLGRGTTTLEIAEDEGPLELIHLDSGVALAELPPGRRAIRLAVPPGRYLVRKRSGASNLVKELTVAAGERVYIAESQLTPVTSALVEPKWAEPPAKPLPFGAVLVPFVMVAAGWASGQPEVNPTDMAGSRLEAPFRSARAGLLTVGVEAGVLVAPRLLLGAQLRYQIVTGATSVHDASCPVGGCQPPKGSLALLAKVATPVLRAERMQLLASVSAGYGRVRHIIRIEKLRDCGAARDETCVDTLAAGPGLVGAGLALMYDLGGRLALQAALGALVGFPSAALDGELGLGLVVKF